MRIGKIIFMIGLGREIFGSLFISKVAFPERFYEKDIYNRFSVESLLNSFQKHDSVYLVQFRSFYKNEITFKCLSPIKPIQQQIDERTKFLRTNM